MEVMGDARKRIAEIVTKPEMGIDLVGHLDNLSANLCELIEFRCVAIISRERQVVRIGHNKLATN